MINGKPEIPLIDSINSISSGIKRIKIVIFLGAVKIDDTVMAGCRIDDFVTDKYIVRFICFYLIEFCKIGVIIALIIKIITGKLHGNCGIAVKTFGFASVKPAAIDSVGSNNKAKSRATAGTVHIVIEIITAYIDGAYAGITEPYKVGFICIHGIHSSAIIGIGKINSAPGLCKKSAIVKIPCCISGDGYIVRWNPLGKNGINA